MLTHPTFQKQEGQEEDQFLVMKYKKYKETNSLEWEKDNVCTEAF